MPNLWRPMLAGVACLALIGAGFAVGMQIGKSSTTTNPRGQTESSASGVDVHDCAHAWTARTNDEKAAVWAGIGDSYSAGVGGVVNGSPFGQDITNSFPVVAASKLHDDQHLGFEMDLAACSGAVTSQLFQFADGTPIEAGDLPKDGTGDFRDPISNLFWLKLNDPLRAVRHADVVTLTIGGNDAGFGNVAHSLLPDGPLSCVRRFPCKLLSDGGVADLPEEKADRRYRSDDPDEEWAELEDRLANGYQVTLGLMRADADLYVVKYPLAFAKPTRGCKVAVAMGARNMSYVNKFAQTLDGHIEKAVERAKVAAAASGRGSSRIHAVGWGDRTEYAADDPTHANPYNSDGLCGSRPMINDLATSGTDRSFDDSFHPTTTGTNAAACSVLSAVLATQPKVQAEYSMDPSACASPG